jgi:uncharacterized Tic20 family protein
MIFLQAGIAIAFLFMLASIFGLVIVVPLLVYFIKSRNSKYEQYKTGDKIIYTIGAITLAIVIVFVSIFALFSVIFDGAIT